MRNVPLNGDSAQAYFRTGSHALFHKADSDRFYPGNSHAKICVRALNPSISSECHPNAWTGLPNCLNMAQRELLEFS
jgi:hypothetical protein